MKTPGSPFDVNQSLQTNIINTAIDDAVNAAIADERISAESLALQALGIATGDVMQRTTMMQTLTSYEREMEKQSFERQANQANAETRANRTQLTASTQSKAIKNRNSAIDGYLTASKQTLLGQPIPDIELTERNLPSFDDPRWTNVSGNKNATRLSRWQSTKTSNDENKWVAFGKQFASGFIHVNAPLLLEMEAIGGAFTGQIGKVITDIKAANGISQPGISDIYHDMLSNDYGLKGYGLGTATGWLAGMSMPGIGVAKGLREFGVFGAEGKIESTIYINTFLSQDIKQTQAASLELVQSIATKRKLFVAQPGSDDYRFLEMVKADAAAGGPGNLSIIIRSERPQKLTLIEEYLHGTQSRIWGDPDTHAATIAFREWHVRDFMFRHQNIFSWDANELSVLEIEKNYWAEQYKGIQNVKTTYTY